MHRMHRMHRIINVNKCTECTELLMLINFFHCFTVHFNSLNFIRQLMHLTPGCGISRLTPLYPTNGLSYAPGSQYIVVGGKAYAASQVRTTSRSWDKGVLTDLCHTRVLTDLCLTCISSIILFITKNLNLKLRS